MNDRGVASFKVRMKQIHFADNPRVVLRIKLVWATKFSLDENTGSVEPRTISVTLKDSADSEYSCPGLKFSCLYESALRCYKRASTERGRGHLINALTVVPLPELCGITPYSYFY